MPIHNVYLRCPKGVGPCEHFIPHVTPIMLKKYKKELPTLTVNYFLDDSSGVVCVWSYNALK